MTTEQFLSEINEEKPGKFRDYLEAGKMMDKRRMLYLFVEMYMENCGISASYRTLAYDFGWTVFREYTTNEQTKFTGKESFCDVMSKLHPKYSDEVYGDYDVLWMKNREYPSLCMDMLEEYGNDPERCAAICYGMKNLLIDLSKSPKKRKIWTTKDLLRWILGEYQKKQIIALLKAFDLYGKRRITGFKEGDFLSKRSINEICTLLQDLAHLTGKKDFLKLQRNYEKKKISDDQLYRTLKELFSSILWYRQELYRVQCNYLSIWVKCFSFMHVGSIPIVSNLLGETDKKIDSLAQKLDEILLKIIGEREPVSEKDLIEKYGFPRDDDDDDDW